VKDKGRGKRKSRKVAISGAMMVYGAAAKDTSSRRLDGASELQVDLGGRRDGSPDRPRAAHRVAAAGKRMAVGGTARGARGFDAPARRVLADAVVIPEGNDDGNATAQAFIAESRELSMRWKTRCCA
jgi:hypothetical protein